MAIFTYYFVAQSLENMKPPNLDTSSEFNALLTFFYYLMFAGLIVASMIFLKQKPVWDEKEKEFKKQLQEAEQDAKFKRAELYTNALNNNAQSVKEVCSQIKEMKKETESNFKRHSELLFKVKDTVEEHSECLKDIEEILKVGSK